ncbi:hypothetical protein BC941DRAFT_467498 [Chlamydoabsidia padenii]|nr:hypothetical protein BC941DRAFT_467498 [Chlamydoabsidia padenii]
MKYTKAKAEMKVVTYYRKRKGPSMFGWYAPWQVSVGQLQEEEKVTSSTALLLATLPIAYGHAENKPVTYYICLGNAIKAVGSGGRVYFGKWTAPHPSQKTGPLDATTPREGQIENNQADEVKESQGPVQAVYSSPVRLEVGWGYLLLTKKKSWVLDLFELCYDLIADRYMEQGNNGGHSTIISVEGHQQQHL